MTQSQRRMKVVTCGNCRTLYDASGKNPRCPSCNKRPTEVKPLPPMPPMNAGRRNGPLEGPANSRKAKQLEDEVAPLWEFVAAFLLLGSFITMLVAISVRSPSLLMIAAAIFAVTIMVAFLLKLRSMFGPRTGASDGPGVIGWLFGRGMWDRRR